VDVIEPKADVGEVGEMIAAQIEEFDSERIDKVVGHDRKSRDLSVVGVM